MRAGHPGARRGVELPQRGGARFGVAGRRHHRHDQWRLPGGRPAGACRRSAGRRPLAHGALRFDRPGGCPARPGVGLQRRGRRAAGAGRARRCGRRWPLPAACRGGAGARPSQRPGDRIRVRARVGGGRAAGHRGGAGTGDTHPRERRLGQGRVAAVRHGWQLGPGRNAPARSGRQCGCGGPRRSGPNSGAPARHRWQCGSGNARRSLRSKRLRPLACRVARRGERRSHPAAGGWQLPFRLLPGRRRAGARAAGSDRAAAAADGVRRRSRRRAAGSAGRRPGLGADRVRSPRRLRARRALSPPPCRCSPRRARSSPPRCRRGTARWW